MIGDTEGTGVNEFSPLYALFLASDVFLVHSCGNDRTGFYGFLNWFSDIETYAAKTGLAF